MSVPSISTVAPGMGWFTVSRTVPTKRVCDSGPETTADSRKVGSASARSGKVAVTTLALTPGAGPSVSTAAARPSALVARVTVGAPAKLPPPAATLNVTGTPTQKLPPASTASTSSGRASAAPATPTWFSPPIARSFSQAAAVAEAQKPTGTVNPAALTSTRLFPTPARVPSSHSTVTSPCSSVRRLCSADPPSWPTSRRSPSLRTTCRSSTRLASGLPPASRARTTIGCARTSPTRPAVGDSIATDGGVVSRSTVTLALATTPVAPRATAVTVFLPSRNGTASAVKPPASSTASTPFTCTETADAEIVPVTRTLPWLVRKPSVGVSISTRTGAQSRPSSTWPLQSLSMPSQTSALGVPGVHVWGTPPTQLSTLRVHAPTPHVVRPSPSSTCPLQSLSMPSQTSALGAPGWLVWAT